MPKSTTERGRKRRAATENAGEQRKRSSAEHRHTRELILEQAERMIAEQGIEGLKLTAVAEAVGIRQPSIYAHFRNRDELFREMGRNIVDNLLHLFDASEGNSSLETILFGLDRLLTYIEEHPAEARLIARDVSIPGGFAPLRDVMGPAGTIGALKGPLGPMIQRLQRILDRGSAEGSLRPFKAPVLFPLLLGTILLAANTHAIPSHQLHIVLRDLVIRALLPGVARVPSQKTGAGKESTQSISDSRGN